MQFITTGNRIAVENFTIGDLYTITFTNGNYINSACIGIGANFVTFQRNEPELLFSLTMETAELVSTIDLYAGGSGTNNYNELTNKPQINSVELVGNKSLAAFGIQPEITEESPLSSALVSGLGSAAAAEISDFATAAQGALAASAVQPADMTAALALKQDALSSAQLAAVNSGITSADVAQITTNKNNILSNTLNGGGINKLQVTATTTTVNGIIFTVNADKTITATGSITDNTQNAIFTIGAYTAVSGDVLSEGFVEANSKAYIYARGGSTNLANEPYKAILAGDIGVQRNYACVITADTVGQVNITFKPMICNSERYAKSGVYQPYALSNAELTDNVSIIDILSTVTTESGYTVTENRSWLRKQGKHVFGMLLMQKSTAYSPTLGTAATMTYKPEKSVVLGTFLSSDGWGVSEVGYAFIHPTTGAMSLKANSSYSGSDTYMMIPIDYMIS